MNNKRPWFQVASDFPHDAKIGALSLKGERAWWRVLAYCAVCGHGDTIYCNVSEFAFTSRLTVADATKSLAELARVGLIEWDGAQLRVISWKKHQPATTAAERKRAQRDRARAASYDGHGRVTDAARDGHGVDGERDEEGEHIHAGQSQTPPPQPSTNGTAARASHDIREHLEAFNRGARQSIRWTTGTMLPAERIATALGSPELTEKVARFYASKLSGDVLPSLARFAEKADEWRSRMESAGKSTRAAPTCGKHPGAAHVRGRGCLACEDEKAA